MTEWIPVNMHPLKTIQEKPAFRYQIKVAKGFRYRFWFVCNGNVTLDNSREISMRGDNTPTNFIEVLEDEDDQLVEVLMPPKLMKNVTYAKSKVPEEL